LFLGPLEHGDLPLPLPRRAGAEAEAIRVPPTVGCVGSDEDPARQRLIPVGDRARRKVPPFERWGGERFFVDLVDRFYDRVAVDPLLRPLYPEDLTEPRAHLALFLMQYWGGPRTYSEERGHPRLRMRHAPFVITSAEADAWLRHMTDAVKEGGLAPADEQELLDYLSMAAQSLINARG
jgi:hemoglobin